MRRDLRGCPKAVDRRLEEVAKAVEGGHRQIQMPSKGIGWAPWEGGGGGHLPPFQCIPADLLMVSQGDALDMPLGRANCPRR